MSGLTVSARGVSWLRPTTVVLSLIGLSFAPSSLFAQGCVIARGGGAGSNIGGGAFLEPKTGLLTVSHRWLYSDRHFVGREEQRHRKEQGTQVINNSHYIDITGTYAWSNRLSVNLTLPYSVHDRSSLYEHLGNASGQRFHTQAAGMGDLRVGANYWLFNPHGDYRGNLSIGLGVKAPTGDYKATDTFTRPTGPTLRYVDSSIQPGDGGWGATFEANGFLHLFSTVTGYMNAFYLFNPEERVEETGFSIPDSYMLRLGATYDVVRVPGLTLSLGGRWEGVPGEDVFGGNRGSRRPGYAIAVEPGVSYSHGRFFAAVTVPIAVERNRTRTFGASRVGDAAFADYTINSTFSYRF